MGLLRRLDAEDELLSYEWHSEPPAKSETAQTADLDDDSDPLSAARSALWGVILGGIMWAAILWALL